MENILWHGSPVKVDRLIPNQACDIGYKEGCRFAVYATSSRNMAICFAMGCVENDPGSGKKASRTMMPEYGEKMVFEGCHPNYGAKGYLYKLDASDFVHAMGTQWTCFKEVTPLEIIEINIDEYLELCIVI